MKKRGWTLAAACMAGMLLLTGCREDKRNVYEQAGKDLEQGYYEYALEGYKEVIAEGTMLADAFKGAGIANLRLGKYENAVTSFTNALAQKRISKAMRKDLLSYRATAYLKNERYKKALADCQTLAEEFDMDSNTYFLTGMVALEMDSYDQARNNFDSAYLEQPTYEMAIRIYQIYLEKGMEADGTKYLEDALNNEPENARDYCDRGKVYYYMEDYESAKKELVIAANKDNIEALLLLGMVYLGQNDISNSRTMYQEYIAKVGDSAKGYNGLAQCDMAEGKYEDALVNIERGLVNATTEEMKDLLYNEMVIYEIQLDFETAEIKTEEYLKKFPNDEMMKRELIFLKSRTRNMKEESEETSPEETAEETGEPEEIEELEDAAETEE